MRRSKGAANPRAGLDDSFTVGSDVETVLVRTAEQGESGPDNNYVGQYLSRYVSGRAHLAESSIVCPVAKFFLPGRVSLAFGVQPPRSGTASVWIVSSSATGIKHTLWSKEDLCSGLVDILLYRSSI
jgi:hypothetical protein